MLSLQFLEAVESLFGYFLRILHYIPYCPCFYPFLSQVFSLRSLITTPEPFSYCAHFAFYTSPLCTHFPTSFSQSDPWRRPWRSGIKHQGEAVATHLVVVSLHPLVKGLAFGDDKAWDEEPACAPPLTASLEHSQGFLLMLNETVWADSPAKTHGCTFPSAAPSTHLLVIQDYPLDVNLGCGLGALPVLPCLSRHISYNYGVFGPFWRSCWDPLVIQPGMWH